MTTFVLSEKTREVENKVPNHDIYIFNQEFNRSMAGNFKERLKQADLASKSDNKVISLNKSNYLK